MARPRLECRSPDPKARASLLLVSEGSLCLAWGTQTSQNHGGGRTPIAHRAPPPTHHPNSSSAFPTESPQLAVKAAHDLMRGLGGRRKKGLEEDGKRGGSSLQAGDVLRVVTTFPSAVPSPVGTSLPPHLPTFCGYTEKNPQRLQHKVLRTTTLAF